MPARTPELYLRIGYMDVPVFVVPDMTSWGISAGDPSPVIAVRSLKGVTGWPTVLHEALHLIDEQHELGLEEGDVRALEVALCSLFRSNPALSKGLMAALEHGADPLPAQRESLEHHLTVTDRGE